MSTVRPPLRWGTAQERTVAGGILIVSGAVGIAGWDNFVPVLMVAGLLAHITGWAVMPTHGWRRVVAVIISTPSVLLLLTGPRFIGVLVLPYLGWLLVRDRPLRSYPTLTFVLAGAVVVARLFPDYDGMLPALGIEAAVILGSAWAARAVAGTRGTQRAPGPPA